MICGAAPGPRWKPCCPARSSQRWPCAAWPASRPGWPRLDRRIRWSARPRTGSACRGAGPPGRGGPGDQRAATAPAVLRRGRLRPGTAPPGAAVPPVRVPDRCRRPGRPGGPRRRPRLRRPGPPDQGEHRVRRAIPGRSGPGQEALRRVARGVLNPARPFPHRACSARRPRCAFPGCHRPARACQIHHLRHRADGGPTRLDNLIPLCDFHHLIAVHRQGWQLTLHPDGTITATSPDGSRTLHSHGPPEHALT